MTEKIPKNVERRDCGCLILTFDDGAHYEPCLPCAIHQAGKMLLAAASRLQAGNLAATASEAKKEGAKMPKVQVKGYGTVTNPE